MNAKELGPDSRAKLRDKFAAAALQGLVASNFYDRFKVVVDREKWSEVIPRVAAQIAYEYADAMLAYREVHRS